MAWDSHETFVENGFVSTDEDSGSDATFGVGVEWDPGEKEKVVWRADAERYQADDDGNDIDALSVGFSWQF